LGLLAIQRIAPRATTASETPSEPSEPSEPTDRGGAASSSESEPKAPQRYKVQFTATEEYVQLVQQAKDLLAHAAPGCSLEELHLRAMRALVTELEKRKYAFSDKPREQARSTGGVAQRGRYIPAAVRRAVWNRDEGRCTYVDASGQRCRETACLELHHEEAYALGGPTTESNLSLRCRAHNALAAEEDFGRDFMLRKREAGASHPDGEAADPHTASGLIRASADPDTAPGRAACAIGRRARVDHASADPTRRG
jgi:hypothetical protein